MGKYELYKQSADYILERIPAKPGIALILGSGLGALAETLEDKTIIEYVEIPNFLKSTAPSHAGRLVFGYLSGRYVVCMQGRFHYYEGYDHEQLALPVRVMSLIGVTKTILTNAAGAVNTAYRVGDFMVIRDHINLLGISPMRGANIEEFGSRFFDTTFLYTPVFRRLALDCAKRIGQEFRTHEGVYMFTPGPHYETPAEIRAFRMLGADAVGMSTVPEALTAAHCGMEILGISLMTNMAAGVLPQPLSGDEVVEIATEAAGRFSELVREIVGKI